MAEREDAAGAVGTPGLEKVDLLLEESRAYRYRDPRETVRLAEQALDAARLLEEPGGAGPPGITPTALADLKARVFAELANAYRLADRLELAEESMDRSLRYFDSGSRDPRLLALLADRLSSLLCHRRRFSEALELLDILYGLYRSAGDRHLAGRALVMRGLFTEYSGDAVRAMEVTLEALRLIDPEIDPSLRLAAIHNLLWCATELNLVPTVARLLPGVRRLYGTDRLNLLRLRWIEGRVAAAAEAEGVAERQAESIFREVRDGFLAQSLLFPASLVSLDLALLFLREGRIAEIVDLVSDLTVSFRCLRAGREVVASLVLLRRAAEGAWKSEEILRDRIQAARQTIRATVPTGALS